MAFARINRIVLHYEDAGGDGPALIFSNSLGTDLRIWDEVVARLSRDFRIIRYDKRGHGLSEATPAPYAMTDHVSDLAGLLDRLGIRGAGIVGISVGGMIAQGLAAMRPDLVAALALCDTAHRIGSAELWNGRIAAVTSAGVESIAGPILERWFTAAFRRADNPDFIGYSAMLARTPAEGYAGTCAAIRDADLTEATRALRVPALCLVGESDGSTPPERVRELAGLIAGAEFVTIADAGHLPCIEQPDRTASLIGRFMSKHLRR
jgi:3-oxoadipate enol-lactonase